MECRAGVLLAAVDHETSCFAAPTVEFVGEPGDEFVLLVQDQARDSYRVFRKKLSHKKAHKAQNGLSGGSGAGK